MFSVLSFKNNIHSFKVNYRSKFREGSMISHPMSLIHFFKTREQNYKEL